MGRPGCAPHAGPAKIEAKSPQGLPMKIPGAVIMLMLIAPSLASGQATPQSSPIPSIEVTGNGEVRANPDRATMDVAVETHGATAAQAASENAAL
jgi:uncharacterized protein YggE